jgi:hypothetical protein
MLMVGFKCSWMIIIYDVRNRPKELRDKPFVLLYSHGGINVKEVMAQMFQGIGTMVGKPVGSMDKLDQ